AGRGPQIAEHPQAERAARGLLHQLRLAEPHFHAQLAAVAHDDFGGIGAGLARLGDHTLGDVAQLVSRVALHRPTLVPPTVISAILSVGVPTPTGTDCPSLPHVHIPSDNLKSLPTAVTLRSTSGPLPIRFTSFSGAVTLPSSIR